MGLTLGGGGGGGGGGEGGPKVSRRNPRHGRVISVGSGITVPGIIRIYEKTFGRFLPL